MTPSHPPGPQEDCWRGTISMDIRTGNIMHLSSPNHEIIANRLDRLPPRTRGKPGNSRPADTLYLRRWLCNSEELFNLDLFEPVKPMASMPSREILSPPVISVRCYLQHWMDAHHLVAPLGSGTPVSAPPNLVESSNSLPLCILVKLAETMKNRAVRIRLSISYSGLEFGRLHRWVQTSSTWPRHGRLEDAPGNSSADHPSVAGVGRSTNLKLWRLS